jgi:ABC-type uncharacterized transport system ATPase subunit
VLADAEALCSRVAILAGGRLVATGRMSDIQAFQVRGWELVVGNLPAAALQNHRSRIQRVTPIADDRFALELAQEPPPDLLLRDLIADGARLVSLNPVRHTLEDYFVEQVQKQTHSRMDDGAKELR